MSLVGLVGGKPAFTLWCRLRRHRRHSQYVYVSPALMMRVTFCGTCRGPVVLDDFERADSSPLGASWPHGPAPDPPRPAPPSTTEFRGG